MGGLVVKKACILSQNDIAYKDLLHSTCAIVFLSTPHRGTHLAETLNRILTVSLFNHSPKQYIGELNRNSSVLHDINEQFKNIAPKLQLASLYETQQTSIGLKKVMVLEKDSSILGYPGEISKPLDADHHNVCKFTSPQDPNYISLRNILKSLSGRFQVQTSPNALSPITLSPPSVAPPLQGNPSDLSLVTRSSIDIPNPWQAASTGTPVYDTSSFGMSSPLRSTNLPTEIMELLAVEDPPIDDHEFFRGRWMPGSCEWILKDRSFESWLKSQDMGPQAIWVHGVPGAGKSILSSYIITHLREIGASCQFFYFRFGDKAKVSINTLLRSLAFQIAAELPMYKQQLSKLAEETGPLEKADFRVLWQRLYTSRLFKLRLARPLYWVIDALDESEAPLRLLALLAGMSTRIPIRLLFVGRKINAQTVAFQRMAESYQVHTTCIDQSGEDLRRYVLKEIEYMRGRPEFKARITNKILNAASGNFLWVTLVLNDISQCHTETAIEETLDELPAELEPLYGRMVSSLASASRAGDQQLTKAILTWATCSSRPLTTEELTQALMPEYADILEMEHTAVQLCGGFVIIDNRGQLVMTHQTAREYLVKTPGLEYSIVPRRAHLDLFIKCINFLSTSPLRTRPDRSSAPPFMGYAATSWSYHLVSSAADSAHTQLLLLVKFFQGPSVLFWIHFLALHGQLRSLLYASQSITSYLKKQALIDAERSPMTHRLQEKELVECWATDLVKIVGKFGSNLVRHPRSIHAFIPAFCPTSSMIHRQFWSQKASSSLSVRGFKSDAWDDCLAKFSISRNSRPLKLTCSDNYFAILTSDGTLILYRAATCDILRNFMHGERVLCFNFGDSWRKLVTYGFLTTKVWDVQSGRQIYSFRNPTGAKAQAVSFYQDEDTLISCSDDRCIRKADLDGSSSVSWEVMEPSPGGDGYDGKLYNSPKRVAISPDGLQVAIAYRGFPLLVWGTDPPGLIGRCERITDRSKSRHELWTDVGPICWNPVSGHVLGLYNDGCVFKWHPIDQDNQELNTVAADIKCSPSGNLFVTSTVDGSLRIWSFQHFALIYSLSCHTPVTDLATSPDGRRIYDLRESFCNVWEPNALIRLAESDDKASETSSTLGSFSQAPEAVNEMSEPITALAISPRNSNYCIGDEAGCLRLHECGKSASKIITQSFMPVDHALWSEDGVVLITADLGSKLSVWKLDPKAPKVEPTLSFHAKVEGVQQFLISRSSEHLFVAVQGFLQLWSFSQKSLVTSQIYRSEPHRWTQHPTRDDMILQIGFANIKMLRWSDLREVRNLALDREALSTETEAFPLVDINPTSPEEDTNLVDRVFSTSDGLQLLVQTSEVSKGHRRRRRIMLLSMSGLDDTSSKLKPQPLPPSVNSQVDIALGFAAPERRRPSYAQPTASEDLLVFLDREFWVCTWAIGENDATMAKRHFFLPQDWLNGECFRFATISRDGTLFVPRNGEVAVIRNGLKEEWHE